MKTFAIVAAAGSLAALSAPAHAAELPATAGPSITTPAAMVMQASYGIESAAYDDDDDYRGRYNNRRYRDYDYDDRGRYRNPRRVSHNDRVWRGRDGRYYCERDNGTTGLIIGAGVGALAGRAIDTRGDRTVGTLLGALAGGLLGREIDRSEVRCH